MTDENEYPSKAEIDKMRAEYRKERDIQEVKQWEDDRLEALLEQADYLKKQMRENGE